MKKTTPIGRGLALSLLLAAGCPKRGSDAPAGAAGGGDGRAWLTPPAMPSALAVPAGASVKIHARARGAQIYTCASQSTGGSDANGTYAWVLKAPDARLYDAAGAEIGTHGAGPSWTSSDGSVVKAVKTAQADAPVPGAISWLLLRVSATSGTGVFADIRFVQRLGTSGGKAPTGGCDAAAVNTDTRVPYTADYYFFTSPPAAGG